jgi:hypothetical protein
MSLPTSSVCRLGHAKDPGRECRTCKSERAAERYVEKKAGPDHNAAATNARLEARGRCQHQLRKGPCGLLLPCWDHDDLFVGLENQRPVIQGN